MYIKIKGRKQYNKVHVILSSFNENINADDKKFINERNWEDEELALICNAEDKYCWTLYDHGNYTHKEILGLAELYNILETGTHKLKPFDHKKDVIQIKSAEELKYIYGLTGYISVDNKTPLEIFATVNVKMTDGYMYIYIGSNRTYEGFDKLETIKSYGKNIVTFEEFLSMKAL